VGGSKLILGLHHEFPHAELTVIVNTADDLTVLGLHVSPDLDTVMYTLAGLANPATGWGIASDTFECLQMAGRYGHDGWFRIGDRDLATHLTRTRALASGKTLTEATRELAAGLGVGRTLLPITDGRVSTKVRVATGWLSFQEYFVKRGHADRPLEVAHQGIEDSSPTAEVKAALANADMIIVAPSNPVVSIGPILATPGFRECLVSASAPKVAMSPFIGRHAIAGPADALMVASRHEPTSEGLARMYAGWLDRLVVHEDDSDMVPAIEATGVSALATQTLMADLEAKQRLARFVVEAR
jgi:LPPG:FO 2-phospho-L-lactate transferase